MGDFSLSLSLSLLALFTRLWAKLKGFFTHFIVVSSRFIVNFSYFIVVLTHLFAYKRHFLGHYAFLKFLNALFLGFLRLSLRTVCLKTADFVILSVAKNPKNLRYALFMDTSLTLSMTRFMTQRVFGMTNSGFCLKMTDIFTQILKQKFTKFISYTHILKHKCKFFTQNSKHFINSTHFITLSQISSLMQGFFIFLPQVFAQCKLIKNFLQGGHCV